MTNTNSKATEYQDAIQQIDVCASVGEAQRIVAAMAGQEGYICGRVLPAGPGKPIRAQTFFVDSYPSFDIPLCDGQRRVRLDPGTIALCAL